MGIRQTITNNNSGEQYIYCYDFGYQPFLSGTQNYLIVERINNGEIEYDSCWWEEYFVEFELIA
jgi:hypothetical protein